MNGTPIDIKALQRMLDELRSSITTLQSVGADVETLQAQAAQIEQQIITGGGAVVAGGVRAERDFIGRDQININLINSTNRFVQSLQKRLSPRLSERELSEATRAYLQAIYDRHCYLSLKGMGVSDRIPLRMPLLDLYISLKARLELPEGETWKRQLQLAGRELPEDKKSAMRLGDPQPVLGILRQHSGLIVLGDPGAGKTTTLKYLALMAAMCRDEELGLGERLPVLVPLSAYANQLQNDDVRLDDFIAGYFHELGSNLPVAEMLEDAFKAGIALLLLDGLDEVKDLDLRHTVVERVIDFYTFHRRVGNKFVLTSRVVGYKSVRPTAEGLLECTLVDLEDEEIEEFVQRWTAALERQAQDDPPLVHADAQRERQELIDSIHGNPGVRRLAANPLLLTILALMKRQGVTLPERRVELYDRYVETLLSTWNRARSLSGRALSSDLDVVQTTRTLASLALWMHQVNPGVGLVHREDLRRKLVELLAQGNDPNPESAARRFLEDVRQHSALLLERGPEEYGFIHLTFEEYLAAVAIALDGQGDAERIAACLSQHVGDQAWREITLLAVSYIGIRQQLPRVAGDVIEKLINQRSGQPGESVVLAGEAVMEALPGGVPTDSKVRVTAALISTLQNAGVVLAIRRQSGLVLGRLGWLPEDLNTFVEVPAGEFLYGEVNERRVIPYRYWIGKYPVTNAQFVRFMDDGGYEHQDYWSQDGWEWRTEGYERNSWEHHVRSWLAQRPPENRSRPYYWGDSELRNPIFPVVGVSWFEAEAYCNWLSRQNLSMGIPHGYVARLPMEEEWERAARGIDGLTWPWGNTFDLGKANVAVERFDAIGTTAVCTYPQGASPLGAWDMSGNVYEWTIGWYDSKERSRALRGGSWLNHQSYARCAYRDRHIPDLFNNHLGFRVVVSLADPGF